MHETTPPPPTPPPTAPPLQPSPGSSGDGSPAASPVTGPTSPAPLSPSETTTWTVLCHLAALAGGLGIPFGNILGPLLVWIVKREADPQVDAHGKESLNFQISVTIYAVVLTLITVGLFIFYLAVALPFDERLLPFSGFALTALLGSFLILFDAVLVIVGCIKASKGELFRYPLTLRLIR